MLSPDNFGSELQQDARLPHIRNTLNPGFPGVSSMPRLIMSPGMINQTSRVLRYGGEVEGIGLYLLLIDARRLHLNRSQNGSAWTDLNA